MALSLRHDRELAQDNRVVYSGLLGRKGKIIEAIDTLPDLTLCDREPIHVPGAVQPHGVLVVLSSDLRVVALSANVVDHLGLQPSEVLGRSAAVVIGGSASSLRGTDGTSLARIEWQGAGRAWRTLVHQSQDAVLLEAELPRGEPELGASEAFDRVEQASQRLRMASDVQAVCRLLAQGVRKLTGYARVKIYRFGPEWNGEVVAEDSDGTLPPYLGLHFPASDIPTQARALYLRNVQRQIPDVAYAPVPLLQRNEAPIDLSDSSLRAVSPVHIEYLRNMGVKASMSVSIIRNNALWGLVACHHPEPHYVAPELRQASVMLTQLAALQLTVIDEALAGRRAADVRAIESALMQQTTSGLDYREALLRESNALLRLLGASGFALVHGTSATTLGETPSDDELRGLVERLGHLDGEVFATDHLARHYPEADEWDMAAGLLAVPLGGAPRSVMLWFRPAIARTTTWGGNPSKSVQSEQGQERLSPRLSFAAWTEQVDGHSRQWSPDEISAANGLRDVIVDIILRRSLELERLNSQLLRTNEELEAFAYVASHDLNEPLRQIETFSSLLERMFKREIPSRDAALGSAVSADHWFEGLQKSSRRLRMLIRDLSDYSRLARHAKPLTPTDLNRVLQHVTEDLASAIAGAGATIEAGTLPVAVCDEVQMLQVFQNILANAIKYRAPDRPCVVRIASRISDAPIRLLPGLPVLELEFSDNGIGFDQQYAERIFEPFHRLHGVDKYEGSGIGLAICRKIIERHGGTIAGAGRPGDGATFTTTLAVAAQSGDRKEHAVSPATSDAHKAQTVVLVAEDNEYDRLILTEVFAHLRLTVNLQFVRDGQEVLDYLSRQDAFAEDRGGTNPVGSAAGPQHAAHDGG